MNTPKHRKNDDQKTDRFAAVATCIFLSTAFAGLAFDATHAQTKHTGNSTPDVGFPDDLVGKLLTPTLRKAVSAALPWHRDLDKGLTTPKRVIASPSKAPVARSKPTESPFVASSTPTARPTRTPTRPPKPTPTKPPVKVTPKPPALHQGDPGNGCGTGRHRKPVGPVGGLGGLLDEWFPRHSDAHVTHAYGRADTATKTRIPQAITRRLVSLSAAPSTMPTWQTHTKDAVSGPSRSPSSMSAGRSAK
jgi:hypothetical protein